MKMIRSSLYWTGLFKCDSVSGAVFFLISYYTLKKKSFVTYGKILFILNSNKDKFTFDFSDSMVNYEIGVLRKKGFIDSYRKQIHRLDEKFILEPSHPLVFSDTTKVYLGLSYSGKFRAEEIFRI